MIKMNDFFRMTELLSYLAEKLPTNLGFPKGEGDPNDPNRAQAVWIFFFISVLKEYNFMIVGTGSRGAVFANPECPYAIKIFRHDEGYEEWIEFARSNPHNRFVPKIRGGLIHINKTFKCVRVERLNKCPKIKAEESLQKVTDAIDYIENNVDNKPIQSFDPDCLQIAQFFAGKGKDLDLHPRNVMRKEKTTK